MRYIDDKERTNLIKQIKAILKKEHIGDLSPAIITRMLDNKICQVTLTTLLRGINPNFDREKEQAINFEIRKAIEDNRDILCTTSFVARQLPFKMSDPTVLLYALHLGYDLKTYSNDAITREIVIVLNRYPDCTRFDIPVYLKNDNDAYQSPPTVRKHITKIKAASKWMKMLKNPNHPALKDQKRKSK